MKPWNLMRFLFFYTHSLEAKYGFLAIPCVELAYSQTSYFLFRDRAVLVWK